MLLTCRSTVFSASNRSLAIAWLVLPAASSRSTCSSRAVSPPGLKAASRRASTLSRASSGAAPSCTNTLRAASSSIAAASSSPSARQPSPTSTRTRAASYGAFSSPHLPGAAQDDQGGTGVALGEQHRTAGVARHRSQRWRVIALGDPGQLVGGVACRLQVADRQHDLDVGG